jgi:hypothetical protein
MLDTVTITFLGSRVCMIQCKKNATNLVISRSNIFHPERLKNSPKDDFNNSLLMGTGIFPKGLKPGHQGGSAAFPHFGSGLFSGQTKSCRQACI